MASECMRSTAFRRLLDLIASLLAAAATAAAAQMLPAPGPFTFVDQSNVFPSRAITSAPVTITGLGAPATVTVAGGTYSVGCSGPFGSAPGTIADGQAVCVRHNSSATPGGTVNTVLTVGAVSDTFTSTTAASNASALIAGYYRAILRREADPGGQAFWESEAARMQSLGANVNETWLAMAIAFFNGAEYASFNRGDSDFVVDLYNTFFGRPPDSAGLSYWTGQVTSGIPRQVVLLSFLFSGEFNTYTQALFGNTPARAEVDMVVDFYRGFLNRLPDTAGFNYWRVRFRVAQCSGANAILAEVEAISSQFLGSGEYLGRNRSNLEYVSDLYNGFLRRGGDLQGVQYWVNQLGTLAQSREQLRRAYMNGPEFQARVARVLAQGCIPLPLADTSNVSAGSVSPGPSPFISFVDLQGQDLGRIASVRFSVDPKVGSASRPVKVTYSTLHLTRSNHVSIPAGLFRIPVFGLYAGYGNNVGLEIGFDDGSVKPLSVFISTASYADPSGTYDRPNIRQKRAQGMALGFDFFYIKSALGWPIVLDTDGEIRWSMAGGPNSGSSAFDNNGFVIGDQNSLHFKRIELDGSISDSVVLAPLENFHHNIDPGKTGLLAEFDEVVNGTRNWENILVEFDVSGEVIKQWNLGTLLAAYMIANGDDPASFVRLGADWFHMNAATYDARDDSLIVSSRENFVIKIDYQTGNPIWILGDPSKYWYTFPSLRSKSLVLQDGGLYPIGQHAVSITADGLLLLFNNGLGSVNQPTGAPPGESRTYSAVSAYEIDQANRTARESFRFDLGQTIFSPICSSAYEGGTNSLLVSYAVADSFTHARLVGVANRTDVVFDFEFENLAGCNTSWNAEPVQFDNLVFD